MNDNELNELIASMGRIDDKSFIKKLEQLIDGTHCKGIIFPGTQEKLDRYSPYVNRDKYTLHFEDNRIYLLYKHYDDSKRPSR